MTMTQMPKYEAYKDSGVEWLGDIPCSWVVKRFKHHYRSAMGETILASDLVDDGDIPVYSATEGSHFFGYVNSSGVILEKGDLVIPARGNSIGFPKLVEQKSTCSQTTIYAKQIKKINQKFCFYYLLGCKRHLFQFVQTAIPQITVDEVKNNWLVIPSIQEQTLIANFLDQKTAQLDEAIAIKQQQISLLKERKQIIIQQAVTQGIDPNVPMKDSGVDWIGEIPEHWEWVKLKYLSKLIQTGPFGTELHAHDYVISGIPLINPKHMVEGRLKPEDDCSVDQETALRLKKYQLRSGDLVLARRGELGRCAVVSMDEEGWMCGTGSVMLRPESWVNIDYLYRLISGKGVSKFLSLESVGSTMDNLNTTILGNIVLPVPSLGEQTEIINFIVSQSLKIEESIFVQNQQIEKLKEYKTTLINSAVTGKIRITPEMVEQ